MFSCEYCEIFKNTFFDTTPLVAASKKSTVLTLLNNQKVMWYAAFKKLENSSYKGITYKNPVYILKVANYKFGNIFKRMLLTI